MPMTVTTVTMQAGAWAPRRRQGAAVLPILVGVQGDTETLVRDLVHELARVIPWAEAGENVVPFDALPEGTVTKVPYAGFGLELDENQGLPEYEDGNPDPGLAQVRIRVVQRITGDSDDYNLLLQRRLDVRRALARVTGQLTGAPPDPPAAEAGLVE